LRKSRKSSRSNPSRRKLSTCRPIIRRSSSSSSRCRTPTSIPGPTPTITARRRHFGPACSSARRSVTESAGTATVTMTSTSTEMSIFQTIPSTVARETHGSRTASPAVRSADPRTVLDPDLARYLNLALALGRLFSLGRTYRSGKAISAVPPAVVAKRNDSRHQVVRSAITRMAGARKSTAIGDAKVGPASRITGLRSPHARAPRAAEAEVKGVKPMDDTMEYPV
jgi:hypothetical protein